MKEDKTFFGVFGFIGTPILTLALVLDIYRQSYKDIATILFGLAFAIFCLYNFFRLRKEEKIIEKANKEIDKMIPKIEGF